MTRTRATETSRWTESSSSAPVRYWGRLRMALEMMRARDSALASRGTGDREEMRQQTSRKMRRAEERPAGRDWMATLRSESFWRRTSTEVWEEWAASLETLVMKAA